MHSALVRNHALRNAIDEWLAAGVGAGVHWAVVELKRVRAPLPEFHDMHQKLVEQFEEKNRALSDKLAKLSEEHKLLKVRADGQQRLRARLDDRRMDQLEQQVFEIEMAKEEADEEARREAT